MAHFFVLFYFEFATRSYSVAVGCPGTVDSGDLKLMSLLLSLPLGSCGYRCRPPHPARLLSVL